MKKVIVSPEIGSARKVLNHNPVTSNQLDNEGGGLSEVTAVQDHMVSPVLKEDYDNVVTLLSELQSENLALKKQLAINEEKYKELLSDIEQNKTDAKEQGYESGIDQAEAEIKAAISERFSACESFIQELKTKVIDELYDQEEICLEIIYSTICRLIGESAGSKEQIKNILRLTMEKVAGQDKLDVYVSPNDYQHLIDDEYIANKIIQSEELEHGGCIIKTGKGTLEAKLDHQLMQLKSLLLNIHRVKSH